MRRVLAPSAGHGIALAVLALLLPVAAVASASVGAVDLDAGTMLAILARPLGLELPWPASSSDAAVVLAIRLPRVLLALLVGATLATSGAAMQGLLRNPLADPGLVGVSSGAALAAAATIVLGASLALPAVVWLVPAAAFVGALVATAVVLPLGRVGGVASTAALVLAGVAVTALCEAARGLLLFVADDAQLRAVTFWALGSLGGATWASLAVAAAPMLACVLGLPLLAGALDLLALGEAEARHSGVAVLRLRHGVIALVALGVGAAVALAGVIGFVGLVAPHVVRLVLGPRHRMVLPASALAGAILLVLADAVARTVAAPAELPIGIVTALAGAPLLLALLGRAARSEVRP